MTTALKNIEIVIFTLQSIGIAGYALGMYLSPILLAGGILILLSLRAILWHISEESQFARCVGVQMLSVITTAVLALHESSYLKPHYIGGAVSVVVTLSLLYLKPKRIDSPFLVGAIVHLFTFAIVMTTLASSSFLTMVAGPIIVLVAVAIATQLWKEDETEHG